MPSIITISETKLNDNNQHLHNINIPGYNFVGSIIISSIYRHPHGTAENFCELLRQKLNHLNNCSYEVYIAGDINIDFYKYHSDKFTSQYLDMLFDLGYMPLITKATR
ncbi:unnamed protein product, partial [Porites evermanni]